MKSPLSLIALAATFTVPASALAESAVGFDNEVGIGSGRELPPYLQCVPYAREQSGIQIYGDAHTWWDQAEGKFDRGNKPKVGAVMAFQPHRNMRLGHVAAVSKIIDRRTVLLRHSNWSPINGRRGQIENDVKAIDVSPGNDWSEVRVWYDPIQNLGKTPWPIHGFIYAKKARGGKSHTPKTRVARAPAPVVKPVTKEPSPEFLQAFSQLETQPNKSVAVKPQRSAVSRPAVIHTAQAKPVTVPKTRARTSDPVANAISLYD